MATRDGKETVVVPAHGLHQAIAAAAKYSKRQIPGQGKATWTAKFLSGIALLEDPALNDVPEPVKLRAQSELAVLGLVEHLSRNQQVAKHEAEPSPERVGEVARTTMMRLQEAIGRRDGG